MAKSTRQRIHMDTSSSVHPLKETEIKSDSNPIEELPSGSDTKKFGIDLIVEAIKEVGLSKKGASLQAIKKWMEANKENHRCPSPPGLKKAILKGIESGILVRPSHCRAAHGVNGSFALAPMKELPAKDEIEASNSSPSQVLKRAPKEPKQAAPQKEKKTKAVNRGLSNSFSEAGAPENADKQLEVKGKQRSSSANATKQKDKIKSKKPLKAQPAENALKSKTSAAKNTNRLKAPIKRSEDLKAKGKAKSNAAGSLQQDVVGEADSKDLGKRKPKAPRNKKLYDSSIEIARKDLSDTEIDVKHRRLKSLKSHSSDTELEISRHHKEKTQKKIIKVKIGPRKANVKESFAVSRDEL